MSDSKPTYDELTQQVRELESRLQKNEDELGILQKRFQHLFNSTFFEVHLWKLVRDEDGEIRTWSLVDANQNALKSWNENLSDIQGKTTDEIFPKSNATELFMPTVKKIFREGKAHSWDTYFPDTDQHLFMASIPFDEYFYSVGIDLSDTILKNKVDQKQAKETELSLLQTQLVLESSGVAIWKYNLKENSLAWDDSMYKLYEIRRQDFTGDYEAWETSLHPDDRERGDQEIESAIKGDQDFDTVFRIVTPSKTVKFIRAKAQIFKDENGDPEIMLGTNWDVTQEKKVQKLLVEAKENAEKFAKEKALFLAKMSHEIRTPMNGIIGMASLLEKTHLEPEQQDMVSTVTSCGESLLSIINDVLDFSKIETGNLNLDMSDFDLHQCLKDVVNLFSSVAAEKEATISLEIDGEVPQLIHSDVVRLRQVLSNLLSNAIKFSKEKGKVVLGVKVAKIEGSKIDLSFSVKDEGIGLSEEERERVFEEYTQGDDSIARRYGGTGLGLSISLKIAELMGGYLDVESEKGRGSTFFFVVEVLEGQEQEMEGEKNEVRKLADDFPIEILVVEDNKINQKVASKTLSSIGYTCDIANDGLEAIEKCKVKSYDLILMDLQMPNMDGFTATEALLEMNPRMYIVAMTANVLEEDRKRCFSYGMKDFLGKPFKATELQHQIEKVVKDSGN